MLSLLKVLGRGVLTTVLLPFILVIWVLYAVYCVGLFIFMFFKSTIEYFQGKSFNADLPEDLEARRMILEKEKSEEQARDALSMMYQNAMTQTINPPSEPEFEHHEESYDENPQDEEPYGNDYFDSFDQDKSEPIDDEYGDDLDDLRGN